MIDWARAFEIFIIGFGGVFLTLIILLSGVVLFSRIVNSLINALTIKSD
ncbi:MAG: hypothetical protein M0Q23_06380 [Syntrophales bacterium]|jgi:Na+-transporting methylmalonyl-CoA/oxaloacetate decarboxylase gamma subunit|nr:hypothetical protein [Syntrophales bacterium]MCK9528260.1 hypothetical protein [Syntrophales bacterium]MDX9922392.1 OadG-related small transporter subunit [Syntrophales bacterium]